MNKQVCFSASLQNKQVCFSASLQNKQVCFSASLQNKQVCFSQAQNKQVCFSSVRRWTRNRNKGFGLIEVIVAIAIIAISLFALVNAANLAFILVNENANEKRAAFLLEEGIETVRVIRDASWSGTIAPLNLGTPYYSSFNAQWGLSTADPGPIDGKFSRKITFEAVYRRNSDDDIVDLGSPDPKTLDPDTKKVTVTVTWTMPGGSAKTRSLATYITNLFSN